MLETRIGETLPLLTFKRLSVDSLHDFLGFFDHEAFEPGHKWSGCYCQFYLQDPASGQADSSDAASNRQQACDRVEAGEMEGFLAYSGEKVLGWCAAGESALFKGVPGAEDKLARIMCFVIHPDYRGQGVATALLKFALETFEADGLAAVEAAPYTQPQQLLANYRGHLSMYLAQGFEAVQDMGEFGTLVRKHFD
jgi:ribosomal protein S18 acetylase RimI-like enzyme